MGASLAGAASWLGFRSFLNCVFTAPLVQRPNHERDNKQIDEQQQSTVPVGLIMDKMEHR
jgi:hypothetical protein